LTDIGEERLLAGRARTQSTRTDPDEPFRKP
jgi:hypothetical protein